MVYIDLYTDILYQLKGAIGVAVLLGIIIVVKIIKEKIKNYENTRTKKH